MDNQEKLSYKEKQELKAKYIPLCCEGKLSIRKCAEILGIAPVSVFKLKERYKEKGNLAFVNGHKGKKYPSKFTEDVVDSVVKIYNDLYGNNTFENENGKEFYRTITENYGISVSYNKVLEILNSIETREIVSNKYLRVSNLDFSDFLKLYDLFLKRSDSISSCSILEKYGFVYLSDLIFDRAYLCLKKIFKIQKLNNFRTSYSLFEYIIKNNIIDIKEEWNHWLNNHKYFTFIYDERIMEKVLDDIVTIYLNMFKKIKVFLEKQELSPTKGL